MLDLVQSDLEKAGLRTQRIDGQVSLQKRRTAIEQFNSDSGCTVMLASIGSAGEGYVVPVQPSFPSITTARQLVVATRNPMPRIDIVIDNQDRSHLGLSRSYIGAAVEPNVRGTSCWESSSYWTSPAGICDAVRCSPIDRNCKLRRFSSLPN